MEAQRSTLTCERTTRPVNFFPSSDRRPRVTSRTSHRSSRTGSHRTGSHTIRSHRRASSGMATTRLHAATSVAVLTTMMALLTLPQAEPRYSSPSATWSAPPTAITTRAPVAVSSYDRARTIASPPVAAQPRSTGKWTIKVRDWRRAFARGDQARIDRCQATLWWGPYPGKAAGRTQLLRLLALGQVAPEGLDVQDQESDRHGAHLPRLRPWLRQPPWRLECRPDRGGPHSDHL
jgi:hypothetical protein